MALKGLGGVVWIVRVVKVQPDEKRAFPMMAEPTHGTVRHVLRAPLNGLITVQPGPALTKVPVVEIKSAIEARCKLQTQNFRSDEGCGLIPVLVQQIRQIWQIFFERRPEILDPIKLGIGSGQQSGVERGGQRHLRVGSREYHTVLGQNIEIRSKSTIGAEKPHAVGTRRVEGDENDIR